MSKKRYKKNRNEVKIAVGQDKVIDFAPSVFDKSLTKIVRLCYNVQSLENIKPICFKDLDFNIRVGADSTMTLSFENEHKFWNEMEEKVLPFITENKEQLFFVINSYKDTKLVSSFIIFPNEIGVMLDCTLVVNYTISSTVTTK